MTFNTHELDKYIQNTSMCHEQHPCKKLNLYGYYSGGTDKQRTIWDNTNKQCRGVILDQQGNIIEKTFPKFWTFRQYLSESMLLLSDNQIIRIPKGKFKIYEKIDGTMVTLYWLNNNPYLATQRSFTNIKAIEATKLLYEKYSHLFSKLNKRYTYIFEAVYPETKVLIDYGDTRELILIGVIDKISGLSVDLPEIGFPICRDFTSEFNHITNIDDLREINLPNHEGFVIHFQNGEMIKVKFPWYQAAHKILDSFIHSDRIQYINFNRLAKILNINSKIINRIDVANALNSGDSHLYALREMVPNFYYLMGYDYWLEQTKSFLLNQNILSQNIFEGTNINLEPPEVFNIDQRMKLPHIYETTVWKWEQRYLKHTR